MQRRHLNSVYSTCGDVGLALEEVPEEGLALEKVANPSSGTISRR
jgi:hypothetical protein